MEIPSYEKQNEFIRKYIEPVVTGKFNFKNTQTRMQLEESAKQNWISTVYATNPFVRMDLIENGIKRERKEREEYFKEMLRQALRAEYIDTRDEIMRGSFPDTFNVVYPTNNRKASYTI